jgi:hypothetical protein
LVPEIEPLIEPELEVDAVEVLAAVAASALSVAAALVDDAEALSVVVSPPEQAKVRKRSENSERRCFITRLDRAGAGRSSVLGPVAPTARDSGDSPAHHPTCRKVRVDVVGAWTRRAGQPL